jgi:hypothetical protein
MQTAMLVSAGIVQSRLQQQHASNLTVKVQAPLRMHVALFDKFRWFAALCRPLEY